MSVAPRTAVPPRAFESPPLRWVAGPASFELHAGEGAVLDRARTVFAPWLVDAPPLDAPKARFVVESQAGSGWRVARLGGGEDLVLESLDLALATVEYGAAATLLEPGSGVVTVHAALLSRNGLGLLLVGPKEAGKTTLACALWRRGWSLHSDDTALLVGDALARGIARRVSLRDASRPLLGADLWNRIEGLPGSTRTSAGLLFHPCEAKSASATEEPVEVVIVAFLARRGAIPAAARAESVDAARGLLALAPYCNLRDAGIGRAIAALHPLAGRVRFFDVGRGGLREMADRLEAEVGR